MHGEGGTAQADLQPFEAALSAAVKAITGFRGNVYSRIIADL